MTLAEITSGVVAHQCNCMGYMGCGVALAIRKMYPTVYDSYRKYGQRTGNRTLQLGMVQIVKVSPTLAVANLMAQYGVSHTKRMTDYQALDTALGKLATRCMGCEMWFPERMGCRNAGGDWAIVQPMIIKHFPQAKFFSK